MVDQNQEMVLQDIIKLSYEDIDTYFKENKELNLIKPYLEGVKQQLWNLNQFELIERMEPDKIAQAITPLVEILKKGYYFVNIAREKFTKETIEYAIGSVSKTKFYYKKLSLKQFLEQANPTLGVTTNTNIAKLVGSTTVSYNSSEAEKVSFTLRNNPAIRKFYDALSITKEAMNKKGELLRKNIYGLNKGQFYEAFFIAIAKQDYRTHANHLRKIAREAKNNVPFYRGGDYGNIQIKEKSFFSISNIISIFKVLTYYSAIFSTEGKNKDHYLNVLFDKKYKDGTAMRILKEAYENAGQEVEDFIKGLKLNTS